MTDIILATDDLTVLGGPSSINLELDFGPDGRRGSRIFVGSGQPNDPNTVIGQEPQPLDMYINVLASDDEYSFMYQYINNSWTRIIKLMPNVYSNRFNSQLFTNNQWTKNISVVGLSTDQILTSANLNVQYSISGGVNPIASSIGIGELVIEDDLITLPLTINAAEFIDGEWVNPVGEKSVHLFITVV